MKHFVRFCHLAERPDFNVGDKIKRGQKIGRMGSTGKSTAPHCHMDIVQKAPVKFVHRLEDIPGLIEDLPILMQQYRYFLVDEDNELFGGVPVVVTSSFGDPQYPSLDDWELHLAMDIVPEDRHRKPGLHFDMFWPRTPEGTCFFCGWDDAYGWIVGFSYEVRL